MPSRTPRHWNAPSTAPVRSVTVVMPVYNEIDTIREVIDDVLGVEIPGVAIDLVIVESNSTDGTRDLVREYAGKPRVEVIFQDAPRGKGNAMREGLRAARGDVILIQDGDREYTVDDYPALIEPIRAGTADFVLGCRHVRGRPMRDFADAKLTSRILNLAHWCFAFLFNAVYGTTLRDPFTMYKVFRRECVDGLEFVSDRFDFDWELVAKLTRRGYRPIEVPVSYHSRDFANGKKVRFFRDPITWIVALVRFRLMPVPAPVPAPAPAAAISVAGQGEGDTADDEVIDLVAEHERVSP